MPCQYEHACNTCILNKMHLFSCSFKTFEFLSGVDEHDRCKQWKQSSYFYRLQCTHVFKDFNHGEILMVFINAFIIIRLVGALIVIGAHNSQRSVLEFETTVIQT